MPPGKGESGRKRAPAELQALRGTRESRINRKAPKYLAASPDPPTYLSEAARAVWFETVPALQQYDLLSVVEVNQLTVYCEAVITHRSAVAEVREHGVTVIGSMGGTVKNPALGAQAEMARIIRSFAAEFGLTPATRQHVSVPDHLAESSADEQHPAEDFFSEAG